ncbi:prolipoprotein diacylglyceryl transferase [Leptolyngbya sp. FACHB-261]|uniref:prolipoprotein diacylglyceryl transferase n=1 Tax=Leptolyngbya sp. FACHB-261 TaxID=2692806 RepID=UPI0016825246|nr:prolipoprotein diacylglyceryl transferase [Leptolyngbya sp. FACHB-261]MBD2103249.1 prolipoprotein diacylglyceryl transferase [Leptolyngbya sp. FACHB-261]
MLSTLFHVAPSLPLAFEFTSPGPILVQLGPFAIRWYGLLIASALLLGTFLAQNLAKRSGVNPELIGDLAIWLVAGAIPAARAYYVLFQWSYYRDHPSEILAIWQGGIAIHGAIIGGSLAAILFARRNGVSFWQLADLVVPALILGQAIGRWGNFFNSEAFGVPTDLPWKLFIPPDRRPPTLEAFSYFHPTFLYESLWNLGVLSLLLWLFFRGNSKRGTLTMVYLIAYSLGRVWIEGLRIDSLMLGPLRIAQLVSLSGVLLGSLGLVWLYVLKRPLPDTVPNEAASPESAAVSNDG